MEEIQVIGNISLDDGGSLPLIIGAYMDNGLAVNGFKGYIDELRIWHDDD